MKKITVILLALSFSIPGFSQDNSRNKVHSEVKKYMDKVVFPEISKQQEIYMNALSDEEINQLETVCRNFDRNVEKNDYRGKRKAKKNKMAGKKKPNTRTAYYDEVKSITDAHPKLNIAYRKFIDDNTDKWKKEVAKIHQENGIEPFKNKNGKTGMEVFFERVSTSEWLLMWDPENQRSSFARSPRSANVKKGHKGNGSHINQEFRAERKAYILENIVPVIAEERTKFDVELSSDEKKIIETARQKIEVRRAMFKSWYESEDFVPGQRAKDPNFDNMREDMRKSMSEVREIAMKYSDEIDACLVNIKSHSEVWKNDLKDFADLNDRGNGKPGGKHRKDRFKVPSPIKFLLFDPTNVNEDRFLGVNDDVRIVIYPNPVDHFTTVSIKGAAGENISVKLYTKEGIMVEEVYNSLNEKDILKLKVNFDDRESGIYIIKTFVGAQEITRKIVVN